MAEVYTGGDRSLQALLKSMRDDIAELQKPAAADVQRVTVKVVEAKQTAEAADATANQAQIDALAAAAEALQAALDAAAAQQQTLNLRESIAQPGVNKFDTAPIIAQNIAGYYTENLTGYSWLTGGIRLQTPESTAVGVRVYTIDTFAVRPGDVLSASVNLTFDNPAVAGFGWSFFDADGAPISSSASSVATENGLLQSQYQVPSNAASLKMNLFAYVPNGYAVTRTWVEFRNPFVGILVGSDGLAKEAVKRVNIAAGAVGQDQLDPGISFGVPDGGVTTPKLADRAVTAIKVALASLKREHVAPLEGAVATFKPGFQQHTTFATTEVIVGMDGVVQLYFSFANGAAAGVNTTFNANTGYTFATIPAEFAPAQPTVRLCYAATQLGRAFIRINTNGDLVIEGNATGVIQGGFTIALGEASWRMKTT